MLLTNDHIYEIQTEKGSNERLFILTRTHSIYAHFRGNPQNDTYATDKRSKTIIIFYQKHIYICIQYKLC